MRKLLTAVVLAGLSLVMASEAEATAVRPAALSHCVDYAQSNGWNARCSSGSGSVRAFAVCRRVDPNWAHGDGSPVYRYVRINGPWAPAGVWSRAACPLGWIISGGGRQLSS